MAFPYWFSTSTSDDADPPRRLRHDPPPTPDADHDALVARIQAGHAPTFETLFRTEYDALYRFASSITRDPMRAEELVQDVFSHIWINRETWSPTTTVRAYLFTAVRNAAYNVVRNDTARTKILFTFPGDAPTASVPPIASDARVLSSELRATIAAALDALPDRGREVFRLRRQHALSYAEIATIMGISPKTVQEHMVRALRTLRHRLGDLIDERSINF